MIYQHPPKIIYRTLPLLITLFITGPADAQVSEILVIPTGKGDALEPTARMARAIT